MAAEEAAGGAAKPIKVTAEGIELELAIDPTDDYELFELLYARFDPDATSVKRSVAAMRFYSLLLGDDYERVKRELRERHGGRLPAAAMSSFADKVIRQVRELKN